MSEEVSATFAHPEVRAKATKGVDYPDRISVRDYETEVEIGAFQSERGVTQRLRFNVVVEVQPLDAPADDDVDRILSYDSITDAINDELSAKRLNLLETLAENIAERLLQEPQPLRVFVRVEKLDRGPGALGVEIVRGRGEAKSTVQKTTDSSTPLVAFLSDDAIASPSLQGWLDDLSEENQPLVLCVDSHSHALPDARGASEASRIALLAIEQNAWRLASIDPRCVVVDSRTEMDWALKNGQISVWAPSKIVLDTVDRPDLAQAAAGDLAVWFAKELGADRIVGIGESLPETDGCAVEYVPLDAKPI